ncbi:MAG TPA: OsmC family protein [Hyphomicrobiales bacterium]|nr:OsmC family protein [Hyphomicrobiales bacterium]
MKRTSSAVWKGDIKEGKGRVTVQSGALKDQPYSAHSRFEDEEGRSGTNPEELIGAAHSGCFAMQLSAFLSKEGHPPDELKVEVVVEIIPGQGIKSSRLTLEASVPGIAEETFQELAEKAKNECPVSKALGAIEVTLEARLRS